MFQYRYLVVGGGMAAGAAVSGIREVDPTGSIGVIGSETDRPYRRPPLSKGLWKGEDPGSVFMDVPEGGVQMHLGRRASELRLDTKTVKDDAQDEYRFDKLLLATGGTPRRLPFGGDEIVYFRDLADYRRLRSVADSGRELAVIGGGFIGSEIAAALAMNGKHVTMVFPDDGIGARVFPGELASFLNGYYRDRGVRLITGETITALERRGSRKVLTTSKGQELVVDGVVAGLGIVPGVELAERAGLEVRSGIVVNDGLRTSHPDVYAAGDVAEFYSFALGQHLRVEHEDNATTMGRIAGRAMAGSDEQYTHIPFFYSDLFDLGYEAVGLLDSRLETASDWTRPNREGVVYYLRAGRVAGVLLWNVWEQVDAARRLIAQPGPFTASVLRGRLPEGRQAPGKAA